MMKLKCWALVALTALMSSCSKANTNAFEMTIDTINEMNGYILKGVAIGGTVEHGCISHDNEFVVMRNGKEVLKEITRILMVEDLQEGEEIDGEAYKGEVVTFYLPDMKKEIVEIGDRVIGKVTTCKKSKRR